jgi:hypothetical protein
MTPRFGRGGRSSLHGVRAARRRSRSRRSPPRPCRCWATARRSAAPIGRPADARATSFALETARARSCPSRGSRGRRSCSGGAAWSAGAGRVGRGLQPDVAGRPLCDQVGTRDGRTRAGSASRSCAFLERS